MSTSLGAGSNPKHAWREVDRVEPPKRAVTERLSDFREVFHPYDEATASQQASRCVQCPNPNCVAACPLEVPIPQLLALTADGQFQEAAEMLFTTQSLPEFVAHICVEKRLCEAACVLDKPSDPVPIGSITRFLLDYGWKHGVTEPPSLSANGQRVAVIGSGLCGLVAADALARLGYGVTIMGSPLKPGGRLVNGLPGFKVDRAMIERRVRLLTERGVDFRMGVDFRQDITLAELRRGFDAVLIALGRTDPVPLALPGAGLRNVCQAYPFVLHYTSDVPLQTPPVEVRGRRVVVLGGGDTAMDALRIALRCGASEALCLCRRNLENMPADPREQRNAEEEGARFLFLSQPVAIGGNPSGFVTHVRCLRVLLGAPDASGRRTPIPMPGTEFDVPADVVLVAYGFAPPKLPPCPGFGDLALDEQGCIKVDASQMTNIPDVFAAGAIVRWPVSMIETVRDAQKAVVNIDHYLAERRSGA
ncbi:MAG: FAD-dependent oxidoreductase [Verrucomicrobiota bacterium]|jgi:glutamate synthase (NADPH/NADH) small chain